MRYLATGLAELGTLPTMDTIVLERFFDPSGGMQLVGHVPYGARLNRALGLALRKRFCVTFDFELQAAASDDAILLSLGPQHSFPLERVPKFLASKTVETVVRQAVLTSPLFPARWRWNLNTSLTVLRMRGGKKNPPAIQRMEADDLMAAVFPTLAACQENVAPGPIDIPEHPLVRQTLEDCLHDAMDIEGLKELVGKIESGAVSVVVRDTTEPSVLAHEILNGRPFTYLDDAPLEERRSRQVTLRRGLPVEARDLASLDPAAIERVREQVRPEVRDADELHDLLMTVLGHRPEAQWEALFGALVAAGRAVTLHAPGGDLWCAVERRPRLEALFPGAAATPGSSAPRSRPRSTSPTRWPRRCSAATWSTWARPPWPTWLHATGLGGSDVLRALIRLETEGFALQGHFTAPDSSDEYCARRVLARIHAYTRERKRREIEPVTARDYMRFLLRWQHVTPDSRLEGRFGVVPVIEQLQGFELAAGAWESILAARIDGYRTEWLDEACLSGQVTWGRLSVRSSEPDAAPRRGGLTPSRATPITLTIRDDLPWLLTAARGDRRPAPPGPGRTQDVLEALAEHGALFPPDLVTLTRRLPTEVEEALWDGVARGLVTADGFRAIRSLLGRRAFSAARGRRLRQAGRGRVAGSAGRWSLLPEATAAEDPDELAEAVAEQLIARWGVVFRDLMTRENIAVSWRDLLWAMRRMEARGTIRGGRFISGFSGEQFALPEAVDALRSVRKLKLAGERVTISAADPLNLAGIVLPGPRVPALPTNSVTYVDGIVAAEAEIAAPVLSA